MSKSAAFTHQDSLALIVQLSALADQRDISEANKKVMINWVLRYIRFNQGCNPCEQGKVEVEAFLSYLAQTLNFEKRSQADASKALLFLYQEYFELELGQLNYLKLKPRRGFSDRFSEFHCRSVLKQMSGATQLMANLALSANLKLREIINIKLGDIDFKKSQIIIRNAQGGTKFIANIPMQLIIDLRIQSIKVHSLIKRQKELDFDDNDNELAVLEKALEPEWQFLFPLQSKNIQSRSLLKQMPLSVLKNDILIATKRYLRFNPSSKPANSTLRFPKSYRLPVQDQLKDREQYLAASYSNFKNTRQQASFSFNH